MASASRNLAEGAELGRWRLQRRIAVGGMAEIFEARSADDDGSRVAVKVLLPQYAEDAEFVRMFEHEANVHGKLAHPNLVRVRELGVDHGLHYLVMDYVDGLSLSDLDKSLRKLGQPFPAPIAAYVTDRLLAALEHVHEAKDKDGMPLAIVHRDVTPQNVLLSRTGDVRLGDFGIARSNIRDGRTRTGVIKGKLRFLAPEQVTGSALDARTDLYAVGLVLFELLTGEPYIRGANEIELLREAEAPPWRPPSSVATVDPKLDALLERALARFVEERFVSARAFRRTLARLGEELGWKADASALAALVDVAAPIQRDPARRPTQDAVTVAGTPNAVSGNESRGAVGTVEALSRERTTRARVAILAVGGIVLTAVLAVVFRPEPRVTTSDAVPAASNPLSEPSAVAPELRTSSSAEPSPTSPESAAASSPIPSSRHRTRVGSTALDTTTVEPSAPSADTELGAATKRQLDRLKASLQSRGILISDLDSPTQAALRNAEEHVKAGRASEAESALVALEPKLSTIQVDADFVRKKLDRTNAAIKRGEQQGRDTSKVRELSAAALQDYMAGNYRATNQRLNQILTMIAR